MAGFDFESRLTNIVNALKDYNSSTSSPDLSAGLTTRVDDDYIIPTKSSRIRPAWRGDKFPAIFVRVPEATVDFTTLGGLSGVTGAKREMIVKYDIVGFMGLEGGHKSFETLETDMRVLAKNISAIFRAENDGSGTALWVAPIFYNFDFEEVDGALIGAVLVELEAKYLFS